ncbi:unnamed protein product [Amoebophrya sp. A120]|nr:unnamed protein product [Amoebophrya sp. A120]|eukprot:GSA120T00015794001.1
MARGSAAPRVSCGNPLRRIFLLGLQVQQGEHHPGRRESMRKVSFKSPEFRAIPAVGNQTPLSEARIKTQPRRGRLSSPETLNGARPFRVAPTPGSAWAARRGLPRPGARGPLGASPVPRPRPLLSLPLPIFFLPSCVAAGSCFVYFRSGARAVFPTQPAAPLGARAIRPSLAGNGGPRAHRYFQGAARRCRVALW